MTIIGRADKKDRPPLGIVIGMSFVSVWVYGDRYYKNTLDKDRGSSYNKVINYIVAYQTDEVEIKIWDALTESGGAEKPAVSSILNGPLRV